MIEAPFKPPVIDSASWVDAMTDIGMAQTRYIHHRDIIRLSMAESFEELLSKATWND